MPQDPPHTDPSTPGLPPPGRTAPGRRAAPLWFGLLGGAVAWFVHHALGYSLVEINCHSGLLAFEVLGMDAALFIGLIVTILAAAVAVAAGVSAYRSRTRELAVATSEPGAPEWRVRTRFMAMVGLLISALFLLAILSSASAFIFLLPC